MMHDRGAVGDFLDGSSDMFLGPSRDAQKRLRSSKGGIVLE